MSTCIACKFCGKQVTFDSSWTYGICKHCGKLITFPVCDDPNEIAQFEQAYSLYRCGEFEAAAEVFQTLSKSGDPEAFWCLALCDYQISYCLDDSAMEPSPSIGGDKTAPFTENKKYIHALSLSNDERRRIYEVSAARIERVQTPRFASARWTQENFTNEDETVFPNFLIRTLRAMLVVLPIVCACLLIMVLMIRVLMPAVKYNKAQNKLLAEDYVGAISMFSALDEYKDAPDYLKDAQYAYAEQLTVQGEFEVAMELYEELGNYKDATEKLAKLEAFHK